MIIASEDKRRSKLGLSPNRISIVGREGDLAIHRAKGAFKGYEAECLRFYENGVWKQN